MPGPRACQGREGELEMKIVPLPMTLVLTIHQYRQMRERWPEEPVLDVRNGYELWVSESFNGPAKRPSEIEAERVKLEGTEE